MRVEIAVSIHDMVPGYQVRTCCVVVLHALNGLFLEKAKHCNFELPINDRYRASHVDTSKYLFPSTTSTLLLGHL